MSSSRQQSKLQEAKAEVLSLLKGLSDKVDLERRLGVDYLQLDPVIKNTVSYDEDVVSQPPTPESVSDNVDTYNEVKNVELSRSEKIEELKKLEEQVKKCTKCELSKNRTNAAAKEYAMFPRYGLSISSLSTLIPR